MLPIHPELQYDVQQLHHQTLLAEAGLHRLRRTTQSAPRRVRPGLRPLVMRAAQWLRAARAGTVLASQPVTQVYQHLRHTQQRR